MKIKRLVIFLLIIFALALLSIYQPEFTGKTTFVEYEPEPAFVLRVIDGDTIETDLGTVRMLGINTPERGKPGYDEATEFLQQIENKSIELLRDYEDTDKYSRLLRYVYYNSEFLNLEILEKGYATAYMTDDLRYEEKLLRAESSAQSAGRGIWEMSGEDCAQCIKLIEIGYDTEPEFFVLENACNFYCDLDGWYVKDASRNVFWLDGIGPNSQTRIESSKYVWNNDGDEFFLRDAEGLLVVYYKY